jgi:hypothetical protein
VDQFDREVLQYVEAFFQQTLPLALESAVLKQWVIKPLQIFNYDALPTFLII